MHVANRVLAICTLAMASTISAQTVDGPAAKIRYSVEDRQKAQPKIPSGSPLESVCHLKTRRTFHLLGFGWSRNTGSGVLYKDRYIITAGHNIFQDFTNLKSISVQCGTTDAEATVDMVAYSRGEWEARDAKDYFPFGGKDFHRDFGVIRLKEPISVAKPFKLATNQGRAEEEVQFAGYPVEKDKKNNVLNGRNGYRLFYATATLKDDPALRRYKATRDLIYYDLKTFGSNSGGPVWRMGSEGMPELVAVHVTNSGGRIVDEPFRNEIHRLIDVLDKRAAHR